MIWDTDEYLIKDLVEQLKRDRDAAVAERDAMSRMLEVYRLDKKNYTKEQIAEELSISVEEVQQILQS